MNNTLKSMTDFASGVGRLVFEAWGDSTTERSGGGHSVGFAKGLFGVVQCAGQLTPANTTSAYNDTMGLIECRRRINASTKGGTINDSGVDTPGYPLAFKQYGCQIPVPASSGYSGAQVAYLRGTTANGAVLIAGDVTATSTAGFLASGRIRIDNEIVAYTSIVGNVFTGCTRGNLGTTAATHLTGAYIGQCLNANGEIGTMLSLARHPIGSGASFKQTMWWMTTVDTAVTPSAKMTLRFDTTPTFSNADVTYTTKATSASPISLDGGVGYAIGTIHRGDDLALASADLTSSAQVTLCYGASPANGLGPSGPAAIMWQGLFEPNRPFGAIQSMGINQGGKTLNQLLKALRNYDATNIVCEFDAGLVTRYKIYGADTTLGCCASALGGNTVGGFCQVTCTGHNETGGSTTETSLVDPAEAWTIARQTTLNGAIASASSTTAITLTSVTGLPTTGGHVLIDSERIIYTGVSGNTITGITRGAYGTVGATHADTAAVYQGNLIQNPLGIATDILFDYNLKRAKWIAAGGSANYFWYVWVRPIPTTATRTAIADDTGISTNGEREYKMDRFANTISAYLGSRDGFVIADMSISFAGGDSVSYDYGVISSDQVHNANSVYELGWHRAFAREQVALASYKRPRGR